MATINSRPKDVYLERVIREIATGKRPIRGLRVKTPNGFASVRQVIQTGPNTFRMVT